MNETMNEEMTQGKKIMSIPYWYHRIILPNGDVTPGWAPICGQRYGIPDDLSGKRILDIGTWDGFWTWEALKRGAKEVVAIDDFSDQHAGNPELVKRSKWESFDLCREAFGFIHEFRDGWENESGQICRRYEISVYDIEQLGEFDIVFFFGTIYHLKNPLLALEKIAKICIGELYIESAICDDYSPYKGGLGRGYPNHDMVMEFYPGDHYAKNENNWWVPTLQCLGTMVESAGFKNIRAWALTDKPKELVECRGFVYGTKLKSVSPVVDKLANTEEPKKQLKVAAVMSVPRLGFQDNFLCTVQALVELKIPIYQIQGAFWGQCLERGIIEQIDAGYDAILTVDYDTVFTAQDVKKLIEAMENHPGADAIISTHMGRSGMGSLLTIKSRSGQVREIIQREEFISDLTPVATGHFGLTLLRVEALLKMPHPWFWAQPNQEGRWDGGRIDDDIYFWKQMEKFGLKAFVANRVIVGHLELMVTWPDENLQPLYQTTENYRKEGKPPKVWQ